jgi:tetratricopeptide (TPR) repeat protein
MGITGLMMLVVLSSCALGITPEEHCVRARLLIDQGHPDAAASEARKAIRQDPKYADAYFLLCLALPFNGDLDGAVAACQQALRLAPDMPGVHHALASAFEGKKDWKSAIPEYRAAISAEEKHTPEEKVDMRQIASFHWRIGYDLMELGDTAGAITETVAEARALDDPRARARGRDPNRMQSLLKRRGLLTTAVANGQRRTINWAAL